MRFNDYILNLEQNIEETNRTSAALNGMSPLVANKVLENLTINEIRGLAQLAPLPEGDVIGSQLPAAPEPAAFNEEDPVLMEFEKCGEMADQFIILESREYAGEDNEDEFIRQFFKDRHEMTVTDDDRNILPMIKNGESYDAISKAIGKEVPAGVRIILEHHVRQQEMTIEAAMEGSRETASAGPFK